MSEQEYSSTARERFTTPRNRRALLEYDGHARITGHCGDTMEFWVRIKDETLVRVTFETDGCGPSLAAGSMATELATGLSLQNAGRLMPQTILEALGGFPQSHSHCAVLAAMTLKAAIGEFELRRGNSLRKRNANATSQPKAPGECCGGLSEQCQQAAQQQTPDKD